MDRIGPISEVRSHLPEVVNQVRKTRKRYVITRQGKAVAVIISPEELESLEIMADSDMIKSLLRAEAEKTLWQEKKKGWNRFREWEDAQVDYGDHRKNLRMIGDSVDFFLRRHPRHSPEVDVSGIRTLRGQLSRMSKMS